MKLTLTALTLGIGITLAGCSQGTSGGPGAASPPEKKSVLGQTEDTFSLATPTVKLNQGETKEIVVSISRGKNFSEDVALNVSGLPKGVTLSPANPPIKHGDKEAKVSLMAAGDAALGDFTAKLSGHPTKGADATSEIKISIAKLDPQVAIDAAADAAEMRVDNENTAMQKQFDQYEAKVADLKERTGKAEGQAKSDLEVRLIDVEAKLDIASTRLDECKDATPETRVKAKENMNIAFDDLKKSLT
jgi:hypothetical protein